MSGKKPSMDEAGIQNQPATTGKSGNFISSVSPYLKRKGLAAKQLKDLSS